MTLRAVSLLALVGLPAVAAADPPARASPTLAEVLASGRAARKELLHLLDRARVERDGVRATCYDGKLSGVNAALRPLETGSIARMPPRLLEATARRLAALLAEAHQCVCVYPASVDGPPFAIEIEVDPRIPAEDPSSFPEG